MELIVVEVSNLVCEVTFPENSSVSSEAIELTLFKLAFPDVAAVLKNLDDSSYPINFLRVINLSTMYQKFFFLNNTHRDYIP